MNINKSKSVLYLITFATIIPLMWVFDDLTQKHGWFDDFWYGDYPPPIIHHYFSDLLLVAIVLLFNFALWSIPRFQSSILSPLSRYAYKPRVAIIQNTVVTFQYDETTTLLTALYGPESELEKILVAHPGADLTKHEDALGIKIIDVQRKTTPPAQSTTTNRDIWS
jgi:hypothetical protein